MSEERQHWIADDNTRKKFWAYAKNTLSLTNDEVHEALFVESLKDFGESKNAALAMLKAYAATIEDHRLIKSLAPQEQAHAEARAIAFLDIYTPDGTRVSITAREGASGHDVALTAYALWQGSEILRHLGWTLPGNGKVKPKVKTMPTQPQAPPPPQSAAPPSPGAPAAPTAPSTQAQPSATKSGDAKLNKITVDADGRVEFHVEGFRWPFKDARGGQVVAGLFEPAGWTPAHFTPGTKYEGRAVAGLMVQWEKPSKYYDVVRVYIP